MALILPHFNDKIMEHTGRILIITGLIILVIGLILYFAGNRLNWLGHLPGDINIVRDNVRVFIPITTMLLLSALISLILFIIRKFF